MSEKYAIGKNIIYYRKQKGLTQEALALNVCMSTSHLRNIEHDAANPTVDILSKIADELEIPLTSLFTTIG